MKPSEIQELIALLQRADIGGDVVKLRTQSGATQESVKSQVKTLATKYLKHLAKLLELPAGDFEVHFNPGGFGVSGEAMLHSTRVFVQLSAGCWYGVLYRRCFRREVKDSRGKVRLAWESTRFGNHWLPFDKLSDPAAASTVLRTVEADPAVPPYKY